MLEEDLKELENIELVELLSTLEGLDDSLKEQEKILREGDCDNEN